MGLEVGNTVGDVISSSVGEEVCGPSDEVGLGTGGDVGFDTGGDVGGATGVTGVMGLPALVQNSSVLLFSNSLFPNAFCCPFKVME